MKEQSAIAEKPRNRYVLTYKIRIHRVYLIIEQPECSHLKLNLTFYHSITAFLMSNQSTLKINSNACEQLPKLCCLTTSFIYSYFNYQYTGVFNEHFIFMHKVFTASTFFQPTKLICCLYSTVRLYVVYFAFFRPPQFKFG